MSHFKGDEMSTMIYNIQAVLHSGLNCKRISIKYAIASALMCAGTTTSFSGPKHEDADSCMMNGTLKICALNASLSVMDKNNDPDIRADITIRLTNTGKTPVALFAFAGGDAMFLPDKGPAIAAYTSVFGVPFCNNGVSECAKSRELPTLLIRSEGSATFGVKTSNRFSMENAKRMAQATSATFSYSIGVLDEDRKGYAISLSVPVLMLDNGLLGTK
jgi:hypothetical protein